MKIYTDTSAIGGCFDEEFQQWSTELFEEFKQGIEILMLSDLTMRELELAREEVKNKVNQIPKENKIYVTITDEAMRLAELYIKQGALSYKNYNDALHIALATIFNADVLASWNYKHIVNLERIRLYNSINLRHGYRIIEIRTPREILKLKDDDKK
jgi:predicted nucleic acid-binding protein